MNIAGIDYSMTSPAICAGMLMDNPNFECNSTKFGYTCSTSVLTNKKKSIMDTRGIRVELHKPYNSDIERYYNISEWAIKVLSSWRVDHIFLEGYSFNSKGGLICNIAENGGILKYKIYNLNIPVTLVPPTILKKFATGKGNANKEMMETVFMQEEKYDLRKNLNQTDKQFNPSSDIIDAYYLYKYGNSILLESSK